MDINELNNRITQLEEQNKALIDYINATLLERVNTNSSLISWQLYGKDGGWGSIRGPKHYSDFERFKRGEFPEAKRHPKLKQLINKFDPPEFEPPEFEPEMIKEFEPPSLSPPLPVATEAIPVLTIPSAPPKPPRKKIMC